MSATDSGIVIPMTRPALSPTDKLAVTLEAQAWDAVIRIMAKSPVPYEFVAPLLQAIQGQCTRRQADDKTEAT